MAVALWLTLGWFGAHRFYLNRHGTALLMMFTAGGAFVWWIMDGFQLRSMVRSYNLDQELRERAGEPPRELDFMPPLSRDILSRPPDWTLRWRSAGTARRLLRLASDLIVLLTVSLLLGAVAREAGVYEAVLAIIVLAGLTAACGGVGSLHDVPVFRELMRWSHRLRLFYYYNAPGNPLALLFRPVTFIVIYAFATPIGAVLTLHLLMRRTHMVPRILSALVVVSVVAGLLAT